MYNGLLHIHSGIRWIVLITIVVAIVHALIHIIRKKEFAFFDRRPGLYALIASHVQFIVGLVLFFISPKVKFTSETMTDTMTRFYTVEHSLLMVISVVLITVGFARAKKRIGNPSGFKQIFWFYLIAIVLILLRMPYPFQGFGANWF